MERHLKTCIVGASLRLFEQWGKFVLIRRKHTVAKAAGYMEGGVLIQHNLLQNTVVTSQLNKFYQIRRGNAQQMIAQLYKFTLCRVPRACTSSSGASFSSSAGSFGIPSRLARVTYP